MLASAVVIFNETEAAPTRALPTLSNGSVSPSTGNTSTIFNFTVIYTDTDNDAPSWVTVYIDGVWNAMAELMTGNGTYATGRTFFFGGTVANTTTNYYFRTVSNVRDYANDPVQGNYTLTLQTSSYGPELLHPSYTPSQPNDTDLVDFRVVYKHTNGTAPFYVNLNVTDVYYRPVGIYNMTSTSSNYSTGVHFNFSTQFSSGRYHYKFDAMDMNSSVVTLPSTGWYWLDVIQTHTNYAPTLTSPGISPHNPSSGQNTTFWVTYTDDDGDAPIGVYLNYYSQTDQYNDTVLNMTVASGNVTNGVNCSVWINAPLENGTYYYYFNTWDSNGAQGTTSSYQFVVGNGSSPPPRNPYLTNGGHSPQNPVANDNVTFSVTYVDPNGQRTPDFVRLSISAVQGMSPYYNMTRGQGNISTGLTYYVNLTLVAYGYMYYFKAFVGDYTTETDPVQLTVPNGTTPPPNDTSPVLGTSSHYPSSPTSGSNITFSITYSDGDNDAPNFIKLHINEIVSSRPYSVYNMTWSGTKYCFLGVTATYILKLTTGNYSYYFTTSSTSFNISYPRNGSMNSLTVVSGTPPPPQQDRAPTLTNPRMSTASPIANQTILFYITYTDADNSPPSYVKFHLLGGSGSNYLNFSMSVPRGTYSNGVTCTYSIALLAGNYYYYFTAASNNFTVAYPSSGTLSFTVSARSQPPPEDNRSNIGARIVYDPDQASIDVTDQEEDITVTMGDSGEDFFEIDVSSESGEDRVIVIDLDPDMFDVNSPDDIVVKVDGKEIEYQYVSDPADWEGDVPAYYLEYTEAGAVLYVLLPEADTHTITAKVPNDAGGQTDNFWYYVIAIIIILVIAAAIAISLLTMAQKKRIQEYYEDFDTGVRDNKIASGRLMDEDDLEWDDLIEVEE